MILRPYSLLVLLGCVYLASSDYGAAKHTQVIIKAAGPSKEHPWVGYTRHYPRSIPRPLIIKKWHPYWDPTYVASWVSSKPIVPIGHGGGHHDGGHGGGHGGGHHDGGHGGDFHPGGGHGGDHHDGGHGGDLHHGGHGLTSGKGGGHGFIEDIPHGFGPPKPSSVGDHGHSDFHGASDFGGQNDFHGGSDFVPPASYIEPAVEPVPAYVPPEPVSAYVPPGPTGPAYSDDAAGQIITGSVGPTGPAYVPPEQGSILPPIESPPIYVPQEISPTFNELSTGYVAPFQGLDPRTPSQVFKAEPVYQQQFIGSGNSAEDFRSQLFSGNFAKAIPTQQFAHSVPEPQQVNFGGVGQQYSGPQDSVAPFVVPPQSAPLPLENEGNILSNAIDDTYSQSKRDTNN